MMGNGRLRYVTQLLHYITDAQPLAAEQVHNFLPRIVGHRFSKSYRIHVDYISMIVDMIINSMHFVNFFLVLGNIFKVDLIPAHR